jgi:fructose-specific PTS system IIA-like component
MALVIEFICDLPNGVHARPASLVETLCNTFSSSVEWLNTRTEGRGNAKSALAIIGTNTLKGDRCQLIVSGEDEQQAFAALSAFISEEFPHCDAPLPTAEQMDVQPVPESLSRLNPTLFHACRSAPAARAAGSPILSPSICAIQARCRRRAQLNRSRRRWIKG